VRNPPDEMGEHFAHPVRILCPQAGGNLVGSIEMARRHISLTVGVTLAVILLMLVTLTTRSEAQAPQLTEKYFSSYARAHSTVANTAALECQ
jgi:hypothetical protein